MKKLETPQKAEKLFADWQEGCIWSALQGIMGDIYVDDEDNPTCGAVSLGDFTFLAGKPGRDIVLWKPLNAKKAERILVPKSEDWNAVIEDCYGDKAKKVVRYAIKNSELCLHSKR